MKKSAIFAALAILFSLQSYGAQAGSNPTIECSGSQPNSLGADLSLKLIPNGSLYNLVLNRKSIDGKIDVKDVTVATGLQCKFGSATVVTANCQSGSRMDNQQVSIRHNIETTVNETNSEYRIDVVSSTVEALNRSGMDINSIFGQRNSAPTAWLLTLSEPYTCKVLN